MWVCERCGEQHEDQFKECWKCFDKKLDEHVTAAPPRPAPPEPTLRPTSAILIRMVIAMTVAMSLGVAIAQRTGSDLSDAAIAGSIFALIVGVIVGIFLWVLFPYEPSPTLPDDTQPTQQSD